VCVQNIDERHSGCLAPHAAQRQEGFVFFCPYCCRRKNKEFPVSLEFIRKDLRVNCLQFVRMSNMSLPAQDSLFYRYDPPVILVNLKLAKDAGDAMASILPEMKKWYKGNSEAVSYPANTSRLAFPNPSQLHVVDVQLGARRKAADKVTQSFLKTNPLAKIVIILDTHTAQDGQFITKITKNSMESDVLGPVRYRSLRVFTY